MLADLAKPTTYGVSPATSDSIYDNAWQPWAKSDMLSPASTLHPHVHLHQPPLHLLWFQKICHNKQSESLPAFKSSVMAPLVSTRC